MKINRVNPYEAINKVGKSAKAEGVDKQNLHIKDEVSISEEAKLVSKFVQKAKGSEVNRKELVEEFKNKIQRGQYKVDSKELAEKIIDSILE